MYTIYDDAACFLVHMTVCSFAVGSVYCSLSTIRINPIAELTAPPPLAPAAPPLSPPLHRPSTSYSRCRAVRPPPPLSPRSRRRPPPTKCLIPTSQQRSRTVSSPPLAEPPPTSFFRTGGYWSSGTSYPKIRRLDHHPSSRRDRRWPLHLLPFHSSPAAAPPTFLPLPLTRRRPRPSATRLLPPAHGK